MRTLVVIPARLAAVRLPRKPLRLLAGTPLIVRVWQRVSEMGVADACVVATDDESVAQAVRDAGADCEITSDQHVSGTERVAEVAAMPRYAGFRKRSSTSRATSLSSAGWRSKAPQTLFRPDGFRSVPPPRRRRGTSHRIPTSSKWSSATTAVRFISPGQGIPFVREQTSADSAGFTILQHIGVYSYSRDALNKWVSLPAASAGKHRAARTASRLGGRNSNWSFDRERATGQRDRH